MYYINYFFKFFIFFLSNLGYWELLRKKVKINSYFLPSLTVAFQVSCLYFAGLFNVLYEVSILIWIGGVLLLIYNYGHSMEIINQYKKVGYIYLIFTIAVLLLYLRGKMFVHYDNFSHWALVVKQMLSTNRYPNFEDTVIMFKEYPLGSATYIYYVATFVGKSEAIQMFAQAYMIVVCLVPIFIYCKRNKFFSCAFMFFITNFIFIYNIRITDLLVDTLLPIVSMNALLYVYIYGSGNKNGEVSYKELFCTIPFLIQILQIKNSGIFFCIIASVWVLLGIKNDKAFYGRILTALSPYLTLLLWHKHCDYVFDSSAITKHAMTAENYKAIVGNKTMQDIKNISDSMFKFSLMWKDIWFFILCLLALGVISYFVVKKCRQSFSILFVGSVILYVMYQMGTFLMYLFSMPKEEALNLSGVSRYSKTVSLAIFYVIVLLCIKIFSELQLKNRTDMVSILAIWGIVAFCQKNVMGQFTTIFTYNSFSVEKRWMEDVKNRYNIPSDSSYCILIKEENDPGYIYYLGKYVFQSNDFKTVLNATEDSINSTGQANYILTYDKENQVIQDWVKLNYPNQAGNDVIIRE